MNRYLLNNDIDVERTSNRSFNKGKFFFPNIIDNRDFCLPTGNQGNTPHCVGYTVAAYFEVEYWKRTHIPKQIPADGVYSIGRKYKADTKTGTRIEYCLNELLDRNVFSGRICTFEDDENHVGIKSVIHRYGFFMSAFVITDEWYSLSRKYVIKKTRSPKKLGGHCVFCCGYNKEGIYIQNSWGYKDWGNYGFAIVPWSMLPTQFNYGVYIEDLCLQKPIEDFLNERDSKQGSS